MVAATSAPCGSVIVSGVATMPLRLSTAHLKRKGTLTLSNLAETNSAMAPTTRRRTSTFSCQRTLRGSYHNNGSCDTNNWCTTIQKEKRVGLNKLLMTVTHLGPDILEHGAQDLKTGHLLLAVANVVRFLHVTVTAGMETSTATDLKTTHLSFVDPRKNVHFRFRDGALRSTLTRSRIFRTKRRSCGYVLLSSAKSSCG